MAEEKSIRELIIELGKLSMLTRDAETDIASFERLRYVDGIELTEKGTEQVLSEEENETRLIVMNQLQEEIAQRLGIENETEGLKSSDFITFLRANFMLEESGEIVRSNSCIIPFEEITHEMACNSLLKL